MQIYHHLSGLLGHALMNRVRGRFDFLRRPFNNCTQAKWSSSASYLQLHRLMYQRLPSLLLLLPVLSAVDAFHSLFPNRAFSRLSRQSKPLYSSTFASTTVSSPSSHSPSVSEKKRDSVQVLEYLQSFLTSAPTASSSTTTISSATPASLPPLDPNLPSDVKAALDDVLAMVQAREEQVRNGDDGARAVKEWKTRAYR